MPRPRMSETQRRSKAIRKAVSRIMIDRDLKHQKDFAYLCGITPKRFSDIVCADYGNLRYDEFCKIAAMGMTVQEICDATGRPYNIKDAS